MHAHIIRCLPIYRSWFQKFSKQFYCRIVPCAIGNYTSRTYVITDNGSVLDPYLILEHHACDAYNVLVQLVHCFQGSNASPNSL